MRVAFAMSETMHRINAWRQGVKALEFSKTEPYLLVIRAEDLGARRVAERLGLGIYDFPVDWDEGRFAGMMRNTDLLHHASALVVAWMHDDRGIVNLIKQAQEQGLPVWEFDYRTNKMIVHTAGEGLPHHDLFAAVAP